MEEVNDKNRKWSFKFDQGEPQKDGNQENFSINFRNLYRALAHGADWSGKDNLFVTKSIRQDTAFISHKAKVTAILRKLMNHAVTKIDPNKLENIIDLEIEVRESEALIEIVDNGKGYTKSELKVLQDQSENPPSSILSYIQHCVKSLSGSIGIDSSYTVGTHIVIKLPNKNTD
ncbi:MAG: ATP-binding protein [Bacteroidota bacterium]